PPPPPPPLSPYTTLFRSFANASRSFTSPTPAASSNAPSSSAPSASRKWSDRESCPLFARWRRALFDFEDLAFRGGLDFADLAVLDRKSTRLNSSHLGISY